MILPTVRPHRRREKYRGVCSSYCLAFFVSIQRSLALGSSPFMINEAALGVCRLERNKKLARRLFLLNFPILRSVVAWLSVAHQPSVLLPPAMVLRRKA